MLPYTGSGPGTDHGADEAAATGPAPGHPIGRRSHARRVDRRRTPVSPDAAGRSELASQSDGLGFCGVIEK
jgi:hypothetical protein